MIKNKTQNITLSKIPVDYTWSFSNKTIKDTTYITHSYYTYPAKFIPQLASRLIKENSKEGDIIIDPFMGSGTTIVEAIINNRIGVGVDINEIAVLLAKVKTTTIKHELLANEFSNLIFHVKFKLSNIANQIVSELGNNKKGIEVRNYFADMGYVGVFS